MLLLMVIITVFVAGFSTTPAQATGENIIITVIVQNLQFREGENVPELNMVFVGLGAHCDFYAQMGRVRDDCDIILSKPFLYYMPTTQGVFYNLTLQGGVVAEGFEFDLSTPFTIWVLEPINEETTGFPLWAIFLIIIGAVMLSMLVIVVKSRIQKGKGAKEKSKKSKIKLNQIAESADDDGDDSDDEPLFGEDYYNTPR